MEGREYVFSAGQANQGVKLSAFLQNLSEEQDSTVHDILPIAASITLINDGYRTKHNVCKNVFNPIVVFEL